MKQEYPPEACPPWYHATAQIDSLKVNTSIIGDATAVTLASATITCAHITASGTIHAATSFTGPTITAMQSCYRC